MLHGQCVFGLQKCLKTRILIFWKEAYMYRLYVLNSCHKSRCYSYFPLFLFTPKIVQGMLKRLWTRTHIKTIQSRALLWFARPSPREDGNSWLVISVTSGIFELSFSERSNKDSLVGGDLPRDGLIEAWYVKFVFV